MTPGRKAERLEGLRPFTSAVTPTVHDIGTTSCRRVVLDPYPYLECYKFRLAAAPELANTRWKATRTQRWEAPNRLKPNNYSPHYGSQSLTSRPILTGHFHFRPLVSRCSTRPQKVVLMPGSTTLPFSDIGHESPADLL